jgi:hypothetical protein
MMNMKHTGERATAFELISHLATPASARVEGDEGGSAANLFATPQGRGMWDGANDLLVNRPPQAR